MKIVCKCGKGCDYEQTTYEKENKLTCNNSRMEMFDAKKFENINGYKPTFSDERWFYIRKTN